MKQVKLYFLFIVAILLFVACSSANEISLQAKAQQEDEEGLRASSQLIVESILVSDGVAVFAQVSRECKSSTTQSSLNQKLQSTANNLKSFIGVDISDISISEIVVSEFEEAQSANVIIELDVVGQSGITLEKYLARQQGLPAPEQDSDEEIAEDEVTFTTPTDEFSFIYEDGAWRLDDCEKLLSQSGLLTRSGS